MGLNPTVTLPGVAVSLGYNPASVSHFHSCACKAAVGTGDGGVLLMAWCPAVLARSSPCHCHLYLGSFLTGLPICWFLPTVFRVSCLHLVDEHYWEALLTVLILLSRFTLFFGSQFPTNPHALCARAQSRSSSKLYACFKDQW